MSSETSTEPSRAGGAQSPDALQPWQLFTLAGLLGATLVVSLSRGESPAGVIFLSLIVFAAAAVGVAALRMLGPFAGLLTGASARVLGGRTLAVLERDKGLALRAIKDLEFDRAMGKVSEQDYAEVSTGLRMRAARIIRQLDAGAGYRDQIEREVAERLKSKGVAPGPPPTALRGTCASCGTVNDADARFCKRCGGRMEALA
jgi:hypothetical protein